MGVKLCICMPTCNRSACIDRVLKEELEILKRTGVDIRIYDSSDNEDTERLVSDYQYRGYSNLFYRHVDHAVHPNRKAYGIFKEAEQTDYDYIWLIHDHTYCNDENALRDILNALSKGYDFYLLNMQSNDFQMIKIKDLDEFLMLGAWPLNSFGASILRVDSFIKGTDWRKISKKYLGKKTLNYSHIGFYYERAAQIKDIQICKVELPREYFLDFLRYEKTSWDKETIRICTECWGSNILELPDVYTCKYQALKTQDKWFLSKYKLIFYKKDGQFHIKSFLKYHKWFRLMLPENYWQNLMIAVFPFRVSKYICCHKLVRQIKKAQLRHEKVFIFGAGRHAVECADLLKNIGMEYNAFIVTSLEGNPEKLLSHSVYKAEVALRQDAALVIIAILTSGVSNVIEYLEKINDRNGKLNYVVFE